MVPVLRSKAEIKKKKKNIYIYIYIYTTLNVTIINLLHTHASIFETNKKNLEER